MQPKFLTMSLVCYPVLCVFCPVQFCEAVSKPSISHLVGPLVSLLLNYVSHVRLCSRLMEHLVSSPLWSEIQIKAGTFVIWSPLKQTYCQPSGQI